MSDFALRRFHGAFTVLSWERAYRANVERAFRQVPFYREQWAAAGRVLPEPQNIPTSVLGDQLHRLFPLARPFDPAREPSPWSGDPATLQNALMLAGIVPAPSPGARLALLRRLRPGTHGAAVLEIRPAVLDRRHLVPGGPRYGVLLPPGAKVLSEDRRHAINSVACKLAADAGRAVVVGTRRELDRILPELGTIPVTPVVRGTLASTASRADGTPVIHDPHLGYFAARSRACGRIHLLWQRFHAHATSDGLVVTALVRRRPTLIHVLPDDAGQAVLGDCPEHATPVISLAVARPPAAVKPR